MYRISFFNKLIIMLVYVMFSFVIMAVTSNQVTDIFLIALGIRIYFYISGICIYFYNGFMVRKTGKVFNRKHCIVLKNIQSFQTIRFLSVFTLIIIYLYNDKSYIFGLDNKQTDDIEKHILTMTEESL